MVNKEIESWETLYINQEKTSEEKEAKEKIPNVMEKKILKEIDEAVDIQGYIHTNSGKNQRYPLRLGLVLTGRDKNSQFAVLELYKSRGEFHTQIGEEKSSEPDLEEVKNKLSSENTSITSKLNLGQPTRKARRDWESWFYRAEIFNQQNLDTKKKAKMIQEAKDLHYQGYAEEVKDISEPLADIGVEPKRITTGKGDKTDVQDYEEIVELVEDQKLYPKKITAKHSGKKVYITIPGPDKSQVAQNSMAIPSQDIKPEHVIPDVEASIKEYGNESVPEIYDNLVN
ncbi:MAG: hypothetical protein MUP58_02715 [Candidatus Nanohaloarchaeota archaeon QJJ-9]|nr:hypothetical protein [Candidatus Nanohaloarchaeota archaeon QJJ-9]